MSQSVPFFGLEYRHICNIIAIPISNNFGVDDRFVENLVRLSTTPKESDIKISDFTYFPLLRCGIFLQFYMGPPKI